MTAIDVKRATLLGSTPGVEKDESINMSGTRAVALIQTVGPGGIRTWKPEYGLDRETSISA